MADIKVLLIILGARPLKNPWTPFSLKIDKVVEVNDLDDFGYNCILVFITSAGWVINEANSPAFNPQKNTEKGVEEWVDTPELLGIINFFNCE